MPEDNRDKDKPLFDFMSQTNPIFILGGGFIIGFVLGLAIGLSA